MNKYNDLNKNSNPSHVKDYLYVAIIFSFTVIFFEFHAIIFLCSLLVISNINFGLELNLLKKNGINKHGINKKTSSRLGGLLIFIFIITNLFNTNNFSYNIFSSEGIQFYYIVIFFITFLGFVDDVIGGLNHLFKLYFLSFSIVILLITNDVLIVNQAGVHFVDLILDNKYISFFITFLIISGFINASNISDGANGILSGVASVFILTIFLKTNEIYYFIIFKFIIIFYLYNVFISKVFLGDSGSYFIGFLISTLSLYFYNEGIFSAGFLGSLLSYPCIEITYSIIRRIQKKQNPLKADNQHLHNLIFLYLKSKINNLPMINSTTGLLITVLFTLPSFLIYLIYENTTTSYYWYIFLFQSILYLLSYSFFIKNININDQY